MTREITREEQYEHIARLVLAHKTQTEIAEILGISPATVRRVLAEEGFKTVLQNLRRQIYSEIDELLYNERVDAFTRIQAAAPRALTKLFELVENASSEHVRHQAARDVLGMAGIAPVERRIDATVQLTDFTPEQKHMLTEAISAALGDITPPPETATANLLASHTSQEAPGTSSASKADREPSARPETPPGASCTLCKP